MRMKQWKKAISRKKWVAAAAAVLTAGMCLFAAAAGRWSSPVQESVLIPAGYTASFEEDAFSLLWDGEEINTYSLRSMNVTLTQDKKDGLCLKFIDADGQARLLTLGEQDSFAFDGEAESVTVEKGVHTAITITSGAKLRDLRVGGAVPVRVEGKIVYTELGGAAKVEVRPGGHIGTVNALSSHASLSVAQGGRVAKAKGVSSSLTKDSSVSLKVEDNTPKPEKSSSSRPTVGLSR